jgi:hypothetical protein
MSQSTQVLTWAQADAMSRSHKWSIKRGYPSSRACSACSDTLDAVVRYCPGTAGIDIQVMVSSSGIVDTDPLFPWPPDGGIR